MINVTKPFFPPVQEYEELIQQIWRRGWITNNGPLANDLELRLKDYLKLDHLLLTTNGTIALQIAIKALDLKGEIITTPFSYVATTSSIIWEGCKPVFVDIDPATLNIDASKIEEAITGKTSAILATHVFGNPCDINAISDVAARRNLKVIYDAAHCFGTTFEGKSVYSFGDVSTASFHATKIFHTGEGGALVTKSPELLRKMAQMRNFGHTGTEEYLELGINGKNSELHAALGIVNLRYMNGVMARRKELSLYYDHALRTFRFQRLRIQAGAGFNYAYYPIQVESEELANRFVLELNNNQIYPRRYFYPSLNTISYVAGRSMPISESVARQILCLPLYHDLERADIDFIARLLLRVQNNPR